MYRKIASRIWLSFSSFSRAFLAVAFSLFLNYVLLHLKSRELLNTYVYGVSIVNVLFLISNFGGKEYITQSLSIRYHNLKETINSLLLSRVLLSTALGVGLLFFNIDIQIKLFIWGYLIVKTWQLVFETLITIQKKNQQFIVFDCITYIAFSTVLFFDKNIVNIPVFLLELVIFELIKLCVYIIYYRKLLSVPFNFKSLQHVFKPALPFFYLSVAGFLSSKLDLYVVGIVLNKSQMSTYFLILNLVTFCAIAYSALFNTFSANIYRFTTVSFKKFISQSYYFGFAFSFLASVGVYIICNFYYQIPLDLIFVLLIFFNVFFFSMILMIVYEYTRRLMQHSMLIVFLSTGILNAILSFSFTNSWGLKGAFLSNTLCVLANIILLKWRLNILNKRFSNTIN